MIIKVSNNVIENLKLGRQTQILLEETLNNKDVIILKGENGEELEGEITAKSKFNSLEDCFKIIPYDLFGEYNSIEEAISNYRNIKNINAYRIKVNIDNYYIISTNQELLDLIDESSLEKNNIGFSSSDVFMLKTKDGKDAVLKIQTLSSRNNLRDECERIKWLQGKINVPEIYYYKEIDNTKYLLMEKKQGISAHKAKNFAPKIGKVLRDIHNINIKGCPFKQNSVNILYKKAVDNIDVILPQVQEDYPDMSKEDILKFLKEYKPKDKVIVHGDYSLPNILIDENGTVGLIDLGDVSISSKYFDLFYLRKSLIRNKKIDKLDEILKNYGRIKINENYMKWISIVDKALF